MNTQNLPFIRLIKTPVNNYAYDVNTNSFIELSDDTYKYLEDMLYYGNIDISASQNVRHSVAQLRNEGFLSSKRPMKIEHTQIPFLEKLLANSLNQMTLQITQECNFRCAYCSYSGNAIRRHREHSSKKMSVETALKCVDFFVNHSTNRDRVALAFYGGEPLLEFELIKIVVDYAEKKFFGKDLSFQVTTNGSLLTPEVTPYLSEHNFNVTISLDGTSEIHNRSRKFASTGGGTFDSIKNNIDAIKACHPSLYEWIGFNVVIDPRYPCNDLHIYFNETDTFKDAQVQSGIIDDAFSLEKVVASEDYIHENNYHDFKVFLSLINRYPQVKVSRFAKNGVLRNYFQVEENLFWSTKLSDSMAPSGPCIPGALRLFVNAIGDFYPCERVSETSEAMKIGNIYDGFDLDNAKNLINIGQLTEEDCKNCWAIRHCIICAKQCDNNGFLCADLKRAQCEFTKETVENNLKDYLFLKDFSITINAIKKEATI